MTNGFHFWGQAIHSEYEDDEMDFDDCDGTDECTCEYCTCQDDAE